MLTRTLLRACERLGISDQQLAEIIKLDEGTIEAFRLGKAALDDTTESYELAAQIVRIYRSLDILLAGDNVAAKVWLTSPTTGLSRRPIDLLKRQSDIAKVVDYLASRVSR